MMKINGGLAIVISFILLACSVNERKQLYLDKIDSLQTVFDSAESHYLLVDTARVAQSIDSINSRLALLMARDTVWSDTLKIYAFIQKSLRSLADDHRKITEEMSYTEQQLVTLKKDIRKDRLPEELMEKYYHAEQEALGELMQKMWFNQQRIDYQLQTFEYLDQHVERIIDRHM